MTLWYKTKITIHVTCLVVLICLFYVYY